MAKNTIAPGRKVRFDPFECAFGYGIEACRGMVTGTIVEVYNKLETLGTVSVTGKDSFS